MSIDDCSLVVIRPQIVILRRHGVLSLKKSVASWSPYFTAQIYFTLPGSISLDNIVYLSLVVLRVISRVLSVESLYNTKYRVYLYVLGVESVSTFMPLSLVLEVISNLLQIPEPRGLFSHIY